MNNMNKQYNEPQSLQSDSYDFSVTTKTTSTQKMCRKGPRNIPLLPRHHIYLFCVNGDGDRFVEIFRAVWRQLPLKHRRAFLKHWRTWPVLKHEGMTIAYPAIEMIAEKSDHVRIGSPYAAASYWHSACSFTFRSRFMDRLPRVAVEGVIAHELGHAMCHIEKVESHSNPKCPELKEDDADENAMYWGFDMDRTYRELNKVYRQLKKDV